MLVKCKSCKKDIAQNAKVCPHCGDTSPVALPKGCLVVLLVIALIIFSLLFCSDNSDNNYSIKYDKGTPKSYTLIHDENVNRYDRNVYRYKIYSLEAHSFDDRAATVLQATKDFALRNKDADVIAVLMQCSPNTSSMPCASATFIPDSKGLSGDSKSPVWQIEASGREINDLDIKIETLWYENRDKFIEAEEINGIVWDDALNEEKLRKYIAEQLDIDFERVHLPIFFLDTAYTE